MSSDRSNSDKRRALSFLKRLFNKPDDDDFAEFVQGELRKLGISDDAIEYDKANFALVVKGGSDEEHIINLHHFYRATRARRRQIARVSSSAISPRSLLLEFRKISRRPGRTCCPGCETARLSRWRLCKGNCLAARVLNRPTFS